MLQRITTLEERFDNYELKIFKPKHTNVKHKAKKIKRKGSKTFAKETTEKPSPYQTLGLPQDYVFFDYLTFRNSSLM